MHKDQLIEGLAQNSCLIPICVLYAAKQLQSWKLAYSGVIGIDARKTAPL